MEWKMKLTRVKKDNKQPRKKKNQKWEELKEKKE